MWLRFIISACYQLNTFIPRCGPASLECKAWTLMGCTWTHLHCLCSRTQQLCLSELCVISRTEASSQIRQMMILVQILESSTSSTSTSGSGVPLGARAPLGSKLRWAPPDQILDLPLTSMDSTLSVPVWTTVCKFGTVWHEMPGHGQESRIHFQRPANVSQVLSSTSHTLCVTRLAYAAMHTTGHGKKPCPFSGKYRETESVTENPGLEQILKVAFDLQ